MQSNWSHWVDQICRDPYMNRYRVWASWRGPSPEAVSLFQQTYGLLGFTQATASCSYPTFLNNVRSIFHSEYCFLWRTVHLLSFHRLHLNNYCFEYCKSTVNHMFPCDLKRSCSIACCLGTASSLRTKCRTFGTSVHIAGKHMLCWLLWGCSIRLEQRSNCERILNTWMRTEGFNLYYVNSL